MLNTLLVARLNRALLRSQSADVRQQEKPGVTVVIGVRNRKDHRLVNALLSIQDQHYDGQVRTIIVDYGSDDECAAWVADLAASFNATLIAVPAAQWNRAHCMNIGLRQCQTPLILFSDADIIFSRNYLGVLAQSLRANPVSAVYSQCLDLQPEHEGDLKHFATTQSLDSSSLAKLHSEAQPRTQGTMNAGIVGGVTSCLQAVGGFDETYTAWGLEDCDLQRRLAWAGFRHVSIAADAYYLHQWHPKFEGVNTPELKQVLKSNEDYWLRSTGIVKNGGKWGYTHRIGVNS